MKSMDEEYDNIIEFISNGANIPKNELLYENNHIVMVNITLSNSPTNIFSNSNNGTGLQIKILNYIQFNIYRIRGLSEFEVEVTFRTIPQSDSKDYLMENITEKELYNTLLPKIIKHIKYYNKLNLLKEYSKDKLQREFKINNIKA